MEVDSEAERTVVQRRRVEATEPAIHALLLQESGGAPRRVDLGGVPLTIGRAAGCELVLPSADISRQHCRVSLADDGAVLTDLGSTNGVFLDGARVRAPARLHPGARIGVGPYVLTYRRGSATELHEAESAAREQARAVSYVRALLPAPLDAGPVRAAWRFEPSAQLGGDAFGYRWLDRERFALFLLDVSGHGTGSALLAASAANMLRAPVLGADPADPVAMLAAANAAFQMDDHDGLMFSLWYGVFDAPSRRLRYACAGHHPGFLIEGGAVRGLATRGPCIGMMPGARFEAAETPVAPGSVLHLFSDGAWETTLEDGRDGRVEDVLVLLAQSAGPDWLFDALREATGRRPFEDDVSLLTFQFH